MDDPREVPGPARCLICLNTFSGQPVATPQQCEHHYCLACITEWAKRRSSCPVDRLEFNVLHQRSCVGGDILERVKVELNQDGALEGEEVTDVLSVCEECGRSDRRHRMLLCSGCDTRYHIDCLSPPLTSVPFEDWICQDCSAESRHTNDGLSIDDSEIDEAEILDLLTEAVPTSSRLRPSTTRQPAITPRRSKRVSLQSRRRQAGLSQTVQHVPRYLLKLPCPASEEHAKTSDLLSNTPKSDKQVRQKKKRR